MAKELIAKSGSKSIYVDGDRLYKVFEKGFPKDEVLNEAFLTARVEQIEGVSLARVLAVTQDEEGRYVIEREYVKGKTLLELMDENPDKIPEYIEKMVDLQLSLFSKKAPQLQKMKDKLTYQINRLDSIDSSTRYELLTRLESMPKHFKLCHGDFRPSNIIVKEDGEMVLVDWVHATQGNASGDVARTYITLYLKDQNIAKQYYDCFCQKTHTDSSYVNLWLPIIAAANLTKGRPEETELLESWLNIADHM